MGLAGGDVGHLEGHLQGRVGVLGHLHDLQVVADHLVGELQGPLVPVACDQHALCPHLEGAGRAVGEQVGVVGLGLLDGVGAVGKLVGSGLGGVCPHLVVPCGRDGLDDVAGLEPLVANEDLVLGCVGDGELDAGEGGAGGEGVMGVAAQGLGGSQLDVGLGHLHAAADHVVVAGAGCEVDDLSVRIDFGFNGPVGHEVALGCLGLDHGVRAARQRVGGSLGDICAGAAVPMPGDGLHHLAACVVTAVDEGVLAGGVDDVVLGAAKRGIALGLGPCLRVNLGDLQASLVPGEAHEHLGARAGVDAERLEAGRNLSLACLYGLPGGAQKLAAGPVFEVAAGTEHGIGLGVLVGIGQEHVACDDVLLRAPAAAVVPGVGEHGCVESRGTVAEPHGGDEVGVAHAAFAVRARGRSGGRRVGAVRDFSVGIHVRCGVSRVRDVVADCDVDAARRECVDGRHHANAQRQSEAYGHANDLGGDDPLRCLCFHGPSLERDVFAGHAGVGAGCGVAAEPLAAVACRACAVGEALEVLGPVLLDRIPDLGGHHLDHVLDLYALVVDDGLAVLVEDAPAEPDLALGEERDVPVVLAAVSRLVDEQRAELVVADVVPVDDRALGQGHGVEGPCLTGPSVGVLDVRANEVLVQRDIGVLWCFLAHASPPLRLVPACCGSAGFLGTKGYLPIRCPSLLLICSTAGTFLARCALDERPSSRSSALSNSP